MKESEIPSRPRSAGPQGPHAERVFGGFGPRKPSEGDFLTGSEAAAYTSSPPPSSVEGWNSASSPDPAPPSPCAPSPGDASVASDPRPGPSCRRAAPDPPPFPAWPAPGRPEEATGRAAAQGKERQRSSGACKSPGWSSDASTYSPHPRFANQGFERAPPAGAAVARRHRAPALLSARASTRKAMRDIPCSLTAMIPTAESSRLTQHCLSSPKKSIKSLSVFNNRMGLS